MDSEYMISGFSDGFSEFSISMWLEGEVVASLLVSSLLGCLGALCLCTDNIEGAVLAGVSLIFVAVFILVRGCLNRGWRQPADEAKKAADKADHVSKAYEPEICLNDACSICLASFELGEEVLLLPCRHAFHGSCIAEWLTRRRHCPHCRQLTSNCVFFRSNLFMFKYTVVRFFNRPKFIQAITSRSLPPHYQPLLDSVATIEKLESQKTALLREFEQLSSKASAQEQAEWRELFNSEIGGVEKCMQQEWKSVNDFLYTRILQSGCLADDSLDCRLDIKPGAGGQEAAAFASELLEAFERYAQRRGFVFHKEAGNSGLVKKREYSGNSDSGPYGVFRLEHGIHRMQRFPVVVQTQGKPQTIAVSVAVAPVRATQDVDVKPGDLAIIQQRSCAGAGGQGLMAATQAIRMKHVPSGIEVFVTESRSHIDNRKIALEKIKEKLANRLAEAKQQELNGYLRSAFGSGAWAEKIRSYNVLRDDVTDHRLNDSRLKISGVASVLDEGDFDLLTARLRAEEETRLVDEFVFKEFGVSA